MSDTRVVAPAVRKIGGAKPTAVPEPAPEPPPKGRKRLLLVVVGVLALVALGAAVYLFLLRPPAAEAEPEPPQPGATVEVAPLSINLAGGHYLRVGFAMQLVEGAEEVTHAAATDTAIALFSGLALEEVNDPARRATLKVELTTRLAEAYEGQVMTVYFTDYVTQ